MYSCTGIGTLLLLYHRKDKGTKVVTISYCPGKEMITVPNCFLRTISEERLTQNSDILEEESTQVPKLFKRFSRFRKVTSEEDIIADTCLSLQNKKPN
jgi:hypothetical protein